MIVKVQRPLEWSGKQALALIYDQERSYQAMPPFDSVEHLFNDGEDKVYYHATVNDEQTAIKFHERAPDQRW